VLKTEMNDRGVQEPECRSVLRPESKRISKIGVERSWFFQKRGGVKRNFWPLRKFWPITAFQLFCFSE